MEGEQESRELEIGRLLNRLLFELEPLERRVSRLKEAIALIDRASTYAEAVRAFSKVMPS